MRATVTFTASRREIERDMRDWDRDYAGISKPTPEQYFEECVRGIADDELQVATMFGPINVGAVKMEKP